MPQTRPAQVLRFGVFEVNLPARELRKHGIRVRLSGQPFAILAMLLENAGEVLTREEMRDRLWAFDTFVDFEHSLNSAIKKLRAALSDSAENPRYIETLPRIGYRFVAPVQELSSAPVSSTSPNDQARETKPLGAKGSSDVGRGQSNRKLLAVALGTTLALLLSLATIYRYWPVPVPRVTRVTQLTHSGRLEPWGGLSTDGARLYFMERRGSDWNLFQIATAGGEEQQIPSPFHNTRIMDLSPDHAEFLVGSFIAREGEMPLWRIPVLGGSKRRVGDIVAMDAAWSPEERRIAYSKGADLYIADADGLSGHKLVSMGGRCDWLAWNPDGRKLRFTMNDAQTSMGSIWEIKADGTHLHKVNFGWDPKTSACCGRWTPDGRYFVFNAQRGDEGGVWVQKENQNFPRRESKPVLLSTGPKSCSPGIPGRGIQRIFAFCSEWRGGLMLYDSSNHKMRPYPGVPIAMDLNVSRTQEWVAYMGDGRTIWKSKRDGSARQQLTFAPMQALRPRWSPDGKQIAFYGWLPWKQPRLYLVAGEGGKPEEVLSDPFSQENPDWSPDGATLVFEVNGPLEGGSGMKNALYRVELATKRVTKIPDSDGLIFPRWSPDGRYITARTEDERKLMLLDLQTGKLRVLAEGTLISGVTWSSDSNYVYFQDLLDAAETIYRVGTKDGKKERYASFEEELGKNAIRCAFAGLLPDGTVAVSVTQGVADVYALDVELP